MGRPVVGNDVPRLADGEFVHLATPECCPRSVVGTVAFVRQVDELEVSLLLLGISRPSAGEIGPVESAQQVKSVRQDALDAISDARTESPARPLARRVLHDAGRRVLAGDRRIAELRGEVSARQLRDAIADYVVGTALARNVPESCRTVVAALESG
jgi:hypothetical protein